MSEEWMGEWEDMWGRRKGEGKVVMIGRQGVWGRGGLG